MPITPQNLVRHELVGLPIAIAESTNPDQKGLKGVVVDESYNTLTIESKKTEKVILKKTSIFIFTLPDGKRVQVDGKILTGRPEDRIKKKLPKW